MCTLGLLEYSSPEKIKNVVSIAHPPPLKLAYVIGSDYFSMLHSKDTN